MAFSHIRDNIRENIRESAIAGALVLLSFIGLAAPAQAERPTGLRMCVSSPEPRASDIYVALAYKTQNRIAGVAFEDWISKGWWKLDKNLSYSCITLTTEELQNRHYYFYAQGGGRVWDGNYFFCMDPLKPYGTDEADVNCEANGFALRGFRQIDTLDRKSVV